MMAQLTVWPQRHRQLACLLAVAVGTASSSSPSPPNVNDDINCYLNGVWDSSTSSCACLPGWAAPDCRTLELLTAPALTAVSQTYYYPSDANGPYRDNSWGIRMLPGDGDGLLHGYMTELSSNCSLSSYGTSSRVLHVVAQAGEAGVMGPWQVVGVALEHFAHNPAIARDIDGAWLLYHIGSALPNCTITCRGNAPPVTNGTCTGSGHGTSVARATSPYGPWERVTYILPDNETNPSPLVLPNGTIVLTARRWTGDVPLYISTTGWTGPYVKTVLPLAVLPDVGDAKSGNTTFFDEDPYLYINALGYAHMLTHREPAGGGCSATGPTPDDCRCAGGHLMAPSINGHWYADPQSIYNCTVQVQSAGTDETRPDGAVQSLQLHARQRPFLYFQGGSTNAHACPVLFTGASTDPVSQYYSSFTMAQAAQC